VAKFSKSRLSDRVPESWSTIILEIREFPLTLLEGKPPCQKPAWFVQSFRYNTGFFHTDRTTDTHNDSKYCCCRFAAVGSPGQEISIDCCNSGGQIPGMPLSLVMLAHAGRRWRWLCCWWRLLVRMQKPTQVASSKQQVSLQQATSALKTRSRHTICTELDL